MMMRRGNVLIAVHFLSCKLLFSLGGNVKRLYDSKSLVIVFHFIAPYLTSPGTMSNLLFHLHVTSFSLTMNVWRQISQGFTHFKRYLVLETKEQRLQTGNLTQGCRYSFNYFKIQTCFLKKEQEMCNVIRNTYLFLITLLITFQLTQCCSV